MYYQYKYKYFQEDDTQIVLQDRQKMWINVILWWIPGLLFIKIHFQNIENLIYPYLKFTKPFFGFLNKLDVAKCVWKDLEIDMPNIY